MQSKAIKRFSILFLIIVIGELISGQKDSLSYLHYGFKPAIVLSLLLFFWYQSTHLKQRLRYLIVLALLFSVIGDLLLMFTDHGPNYFLFGLVSFLTAHIMYVLTFLGHRNKKMNPLGFLLILGIYASGLFYILMESLNEMLIPVAMYMLVILSMSTAAYLRNGVVSKSSYLFVLIGALLFLISDSILALNKFYRPQIYANISIMVTYALAQYFIVIGMLKQKH